jgi:hypothetical protein
MPSAPFAGPTVVPKKAFWLLTTILALFCIGGAIGIGFAVKSWVRVNPQTGLTRPGPALSPARQALDLVEGAPAPPPPSHPEVRQDLEQAIADRVKDIPDLRPAGGWIVLGNRGAVWQVAYRFSVNGKSRAAQWSVRLDTGAVTPSNPDAHWLSGDQ